MTKLTTFLAGVLIGVTLMAAVWTGVDLYSDLNTRMNRVEGYLRGLDQMIRER